MVVNDYFGPRRTNISHKTPNYGPEFFLKLIIRDRHIVFHKNGSYRRNFGERRSRSDKLFKIFELKLYGVC